MSSRPDESVRKYSRQQFWPNPDAGVGNGELDVFVRASQVDRDIATIRSELDRVGEQVPRHLPEPAGIAEHCGHGARDGHLDLDALFGSGGLEALNALFDKFIEAHGLEFEPAAYPKRCGSRRAGRK